MFFFTGKKNQKNPSFPPSEGLREDNKKSHFIVASYLLRSYVLERIVVFLCIFG